ncbi:MAG: hypothetical protein PWP24_1019, partial [Clostridiales bacterium]|nr:hypothetical protein [Clostridiales bacterium]
MKKIKYSLGFLIFVLSALVIAKQYLFPRFRLPIPQGEYQVGEVSLMLEDDTRQEIYTKEQSDHRKVMVTIWYPMKEATGKAKAYPKEVSLAVSSVVGLPKWLFYHMRPINTYCYERGVPADLSKASPLIFFSPGNNSTRFQNLAVVEELVSEGYTVIGVDHPYTSYDVAYLDGTVAKRNLSLEETGDRLYEREIEIRVQDMEFVLQKLLKNDNMVDASVWENMDFSHIGAFGHSYGGATIAEWMARNDSILAGLSYDGGLWGSVVQKGFTNPFLYLSAEQTLAYQADKDTERGKFVISVLNNLRAAYAQSTAK